MGLWLIFFEFLIFFLSVYLFFIGIIMSFTSQTSFKQLCSFLYQQALLDQLQEPSKILLFLSNWVAHFSDMDQALLFQSFRAFDLAPSRQSVLLEIANDPQWINPFDLSIDQKSMLLNVLVETFRQLADQYFVGVENRAIAPPNPTQALHHSILNMLLSSQQKKNDSYANKATKTKFVDPKVPLNLLLPPSQLSAKK